MKFEHISRVVEMVSGIAVVVTLIILIIEVRENSSLIDRQSQWDQAVAINTLFIERPTLARTYGKVMRVHNQTDLLGAYMDEYGMDNEEAVVWSTFMLLSWELLNADWKYYGEEDEYRNQRIRRLLRSPDQQIAWSLYKEIGLWSEEFISYVEALREPDYIQAEWNWTSDCGYGGKRCEGGSP